MQRWVFVTSSRDKFIEAERILGTHLTQRSIELPEIQAIELEAVIARKAELAWETLGRIPVIVEDTGLFIHAWKGLPGALTRWFEDTVGPSGICEMLHQFQDRIATARTIVGTFDGSLNTFAGEIKGRIADAPRGTRGFGWDRIFIPEGETRTFAEMTSSEKDRLSMRRQALERFAQHVSTRPNALTTDR
jgi:non-canonical purine NTP pyrophosphatase (RdgB/HAM1 family)